VRRLAGTTSALVVAQVALALSGIVATRSLGPDGRGVVTAVVTWTQMLAWISLGGVNSAISVRVAARRDRSVADALGNAVAYSLVVGIVAAVVGALVVAPLVAHLDHGARHLAMAAFAVVPLSLLAEIVLSLNLALGRVRAFNLARAGGALGVLGTVPILLALHAITPTAMVAVMLGGGVLSLAIAACGLPWRSARLALPTLGRDVVFGLKVHLVSLIGLANLRLDILLLAAVASAADVGVYGLANNLMMPVVTIAGAASALITPDVARVRDEDAQLDVVRSSTRVAIAVAAAAGVAVVVLAPVAVPLVFGHAFSRAVPLVWILVPGFVLRTYTSLVESGTIGMRRAWVGNVAEGAGLVVTAAALPILLSRYGITGAAAASTAAYAVSAFVTWLALGRIRRAAAARMPSPVLVPEVSA
jgi:O-antigen/teichoic acid export membrane protein